MASALYPRFKQGILDEEHDLLADTIVVAPYSTADGAYNSANTAYADITAYGTGYSATIAATKTITDGTFDSSASPDFGNVTIDGSNTIDALIIYNDTPTTPVADPLIAYIDGFAQVTPNGGGITVSWHANGIFTV